MSVPTNSLEPSRRSISKQLVRWKSRCNGNRTSLTNPISKRSIKNIQSRSLSKKIIQSRVIHPFTLNIQHINDFTLVYPCSSALSFTFPTKDDSSSYCIINKMIFCNNKSPSKSSYFDEEIQPWRSDESNMLNLII
jgi:hypothetical protein